MNKIKNFKDARKQTINKWEKILTELNKIENTIGDSCGFCLLADQVSNDQFMKCHCCLVNHKCREYKKVVGTTLYKFQCWIDDDLIPWLKDLKEENTTSEYLENKGGE